MTFSEMRLLMHHSLCCVPVGLQDLTGYLGDLGMGITLILLALRLLTAMALQV